MCITSTIYETSNLSNVIPDFRTVIIFVIIHMKTNVTNVTYVYNLSAYKSANTFLQWFICYSNQAYVNIYFARPCCFIPNFTTKWRVTSVSPGVHT
jgi:hypothetical protein